MFAFFNLNRFGHLPQKMQSSENDTDIHGDHQIHQNRQEKRNQKKRVISTRGAANHAHTTLWIAHVPGDLKKNGSERSQRNIGR